MTRYTAIVCDGCKVQQGSPDDKGLGGWRSHIWQGQAPDGPDYERKDLCWDCHLVVTKAITYALVSLKPEDDPPQPA